MGFLAKQIKQLLKPIHKNRVLRDAKGHSHVSQQDIVAHLIRVFGFGNFDIEVINVGEVFEDSYQRQKRDKDGQPDGDPYKAWDVCYRAMVRLTVRDTKGNKVCHYENGSTATAQGQPRRGDAHDLAYKGLAVDTPIPTPFGWSTMGDLDVGHYVFDIDGQAVRIIGTSDTKRMDCYRLTFHNGTSIVCDGDHQWTAIVAQERERVHGVRELHEAKQSGKRVVIAMPKALHTQHLDLALDPWLLGYWLGNGSRGAAAVTCHGDDTDEIVSNVASAGYRLGTVARHKDRNASTIRVRGVRKIMADMGVLECKHVPREYMRGSIQQRVALLRGLMDSDGSCDAATGKVTFVSTDKLLSDDVLELATSLGEHVQSYQIDGYGYGNPVRSWHVQWRPNVNPFTVTRKADRVLPRMKPSRHIVKSIEQVESAPTRCIAVDSPTRTFLAGRHMIPTHNSAISLSVKRAAIFLGDQFGLSLYNKGQVSALVKGLIVPPPDSDDADMADVQEGIEQQVSLGNDEIDRDDLAASVP